ncbi:universal stress protein [Janthinobacterium sp. HH01]|uniref:universal stress protein n=1 Tax=Janthinobacterium sp. HH01 TaxID=1198452 RepID=UPI0002AED6F9|nr:universal stress protein [Janthinobacterium sp. HH01]ELX08996.1 universal stress protein [Janthinobacterium sp. HH01]
MSYQTIAVHCDQSRHAPARYALAAQLAQATGAHLTGVATTGLSRYAEWDDTLGAWPLPPHILDHLRRQAAGALAAFERDTTAAGIGKWSSSLQEDDAESALLLHARYADLLVLSQTDPDDIQFGVSRPLPPELLLQSGRPLLLVPNAASAADAPAPTLARHPLLAWDGSAQAARAFTDALPLLRLAERITLLVLNPERDPARHGSEPGADMSLFLARHGLRVDVMREFTTADTGSALLCAAAERACDLLVMGGYGHRRLHETLLGGATRSVLREMTLPVLISH